MTTLSPEPISYTFELSVFLPCSTKSPMVVRLSKLLHTSGNHSVTLPIGGLFIDRSMYLTFTPSSHSIMLQLFFEKLSHQTLSSGLFLTPSKKRATYNAVSNLLLTLCIQETAKQVLLQTVITQMKCRTMLLHVHCLLR